MPFSSLFSDLLRAKYNPNSATSKVINGIHIFLIVCYIITSIVPIFFVLQLYFVCQNQTENGWCGFGSFVASFFVIIAVAILFFVQSLLSLVKFKSLIAVFTVIVPAMFCVALVMSDGSIIAYLFTPLWALFCSFIYLLTKKEVSKVTTNQVNEIKKENDIQ